MIMIIHVCKIVPYKIRSSKQLYIPVKSDCKAVNAKYGVHWKNIRDAANEYRFEQKDNIIMNHNGELFNSQLGKPSSRLDITRVLPEARG